ncbi:MAG: T9SS type A sorting domain-containing protein [Flavobacteriales bacterium]|mgnify:CR=1 FL=1|nr:T9SS type A sorting domain-containing protein [Flavobacteriales bacterium]HQV39212.1 T9SS type A sorting domain-containing protein [Flavobacteriales bacterium]HQW32346.1 T9SS type A sorting domain-containing protein [Flavobacteriales bacterium]HQY03505.1 T9SS type A sorting domain-containing protein [Flavobacteriales bacterium]HQY79877.1 T9SS type A sorting domain-containing protein [Flavobacteriales bacterium]
MRASTFFLSFFLVLGASAQDIGDRHVVLQEVAIPDMPGLHSFAWGQHNGEWLLIGGRTEGLHQRQPFAAFQATFNNTTVYVVNPSNQEIWSAPLSTLPTAIFEQLQRTNMEFEQRGNTLYIIGGYGFSATANDHITHGKLTAVDVAGTISAIKNNSSMVPHFRQLSDTRLAVTGGYVGVLNDIFHLVGGQRFMGRYNPMGPDFGPGFVQEYTNAIRRFEIDDDGTTLSLVNFTETIDTANLHRRDLNMASQIFPDGTQGLTAFSGVFQYASDIPWLNTVDITANSYTVVPVFEQLLNQYHTAHMAAHSTSLNSMNTVFFGGIGRFFFDANNQLLDDINVPFVNTISRVERRGNGTMTETAIGNMPALLGAGAEFILEPSVPRLFNDIIDLDQLQSDTVLAGHIVGGIESSAANIFFINTGTQSSAAARVFRVLLVADGATGIRDQTGDQQQLSATFLSDGAHLQITMNNPVAGHLELNLLDISGRLVKKIFSARQPAGNLQMTSEVQDLAPGGYLLELKAQDRHQTIRIVR